MGAKIEEVPHAQNMGDALKLIHEKASDAFEESKKAANTPPTRDGKAAHPPRRDRRSQDDSRGNAKSASKADMQAIEAKITFALHEAVKALNTDGIPGRVSGNQKGLSALGHAMNGDGGVLERLTSLEDQPKVDDFAKSVDTAFSNHMKMISTLQKHVEKVEKVLAVLEQQGADHEAELATSRPVILETTEQFRSWLLGGLERAINA